MVTAETRDKAPEAETISPPKAKRKHRMGRAVFDRTIESHQAELRYIIANGDTHLERMNASRELSEMRKQQKAERKAAEDLVERLRLTDEQEKQRELTRKAEIYEMEQQFGGYNTDEYGHVFYGDKPEDLARWELANRQEQASVKKKADELYGGIPEHDTANDNKSAGNGFDWAALASTGSGKARTRSVKRLNLPTGASTVLVLLLIIVLMHMLVIPIGTTGYTRWQLAGKALSGKVQVDTP